MGSRKIHRRQCFGGGRFVIFTDDILTSVILGLCLGSSAFFSITFGEKKYKTTEKRNVYFVCYDRNIFTYTDVCVILSFAAGL